VAIERANHVWAADITYIPTGRGFLYRWLLGVASSASCMATVEHGARGGSGEGGRPQIFNTGQGSQFTSAAFTDALAEAGVAISGDCRGRWIDNVFIERLWRSLKYEDVYLGLRRRP
jgi:putative transposase